MFTFFFFVPALNEIYVESCLVFHGTQAKHCFALYPWLFIEAHTHPVDRKRGAFRCYAACTRTLVLSLLLQ